ncbi:glutaredoxin family protein [Ferrimonas gelatinilytica]|uniref:Glutaredoxin family protein n=1 Tax=Ferrimonas gelatinilytica TaxID=1255257 RepID=A0ABP9RXK6_9GAMM
MPSDLTLFHSDGCHLCEQAEALLGQSGHAYRLAEICDRPEWVERYGVRIPVVRRGDGKELGWPFTLDQLMEFLKDAV